MLLGCELRSRITRLLETHQEFEPPEELREAIKCFWYDKREFGEHASSFEVMPDGYAEIIFHFGGDCSVSIDSQWRLLPSPFIMGLLTQPVLVSARNRLEIIAVRCFPWTVFDLLGLAAGKEAVRLFKHPISQLQIPLQRCIEAHKVEEAIVEVEKYFLEARTRLGTDSTLFKAGVAMREANGALPVRQVAAAAHATVRTLERKFKHSCGHSVKDVSGLIRFEQVRNQLWLHPDSNLAGLAHDLGYTDQSHLSREFKRYSGTTPGAFARKAKREKQASANFGAFIQD